MFNICSENHKEICLRQHSNDFDQSLHSNIEEQENTN